jgi:hypothetical protein
MQNQPAVQPCFPQLVGRLLKAKCFAYHGEDPKQIKGDLNMLTREALLKGGENLIDRLLASPH